MVHKVRASFALLLLTLFLGVGAAHASPLPNSPGPERQPGVMAAFWNWMTSLIHFELSFLEDETDDNEGVPTRPPVDGPETDLGGFIDPNGGS